MSEPLILVDYEFGFRDGKDGVFVTVQQGRDQVHGNGDEISLLIHPSEDTVDEITVYRSALAYERRTTRTIAPEVTIEDAGRVKVTREANTA